MQAARSLVRGVTTAALCVALDAGAPVRASSPMAPRQVTTAVPPGLACIQRALGGASAISRVTSLRIVGSIKPSGPGGGPPPGTREIVVAFPDRYKRSDVGRVGNGSALGSTVGFDRGTLLSTPRVPDVRHMMRVARTDYARQMLMRLPRTLPGVTLTQDTVDDAGVRRLAIGASDPDGVLATLLVNPETCVPAALLYTTPGPVGTIRVRVDVGGYREFAGVQFPTALRTFHNSAPHSQEQVSNVQVNVTSADDLFVPAQGG